MENIAEVLLYELLKQAKKKDAKCVSDKESNTLSNNSSESMKLNGYEEYFNVINRIYDLEHLN